MLGESRRRKMRGEIGQHGVGLRRDEYGWRRSNEREPLR